MSDLPDENKTRGTSSDRTMKAKEPGAKEQKEILGKVFGEEEKAPIVEVGKTPEIKEKEVESWLERLEKGEEVTLPGPVTDDQGRALVEPAAPPKPEIVLPLTKMEVKSGLHHKVVDSIRWLAEWCRRIIKMTKGRLKFAAKKAE